MFPALNASLPCSVPNGALDFRAIQSPKLGLTKANIAFGENNQGVFFHFLFFLLLSFSIANKFSRNLNFNFAPGNNPILALIYTSKDTIPL